MKNKFLFLLAILFFLLIIQPISHANTIDVDQVIYQPGATIDGSSLSAAVEFNYIDSGHFEIVLENTSGDLPWGPTCRHAALVSGWAVDRI